MGDKVKPWHNRKPKRHDQEQRGKKPHTRPTDSKVVQEERPNNREDRYGQWTSRDYSCEGE